MAILGKGSELLAKGSELSGKGANLHSEPLADARGRRVEGLAHPLIDSLETLDHKLLYELQEISSLVRDSGKVTPKISQKVIVLLCTGRFLTIRVLSALLKRDQDYLRQRILNPMVEEKVLARAFPQAPNDPRQAYTATTEGLDAT